MKQYGTLFTTENRVAVREDRKTMTRRIPASFKEINEKPDRWEFTSIEGHLCFFRRNDVDCPFRIPWALGDELYIKEPWAVEKRLDEFTPAMLNDFVFLHLFYKEHNKPNPLNKICGRWRSPLFMPKWAARDWLRVTAVKVERLQSISNQDIQAEGTMGLHPLGGLHPVQWHERFRSLWNSINGKKHPWERNEWVAAYTFERIKIH